MSCITLSGHVNMSQGWGQHLAHIARRLPDRCFVRPIHYGGPAEIPLWLDVITSYEIPECPSELIVFTAGTQKTEGKRSAYFTMHETDTLPPKWVKNLNDSVVVIVPCVWNRDSFKRCGVRRPIRVVPLGCDNTSWVPMDMNGPTIFGCAGRPQHGLIRKGVNETILAFLKAFPTDTGVRLKVKVLDDEEWQVPHDTRIEVQRGYFTEEELYNWYGSLTCFLSAAHGEAWGLMQHQAMSSARPVMASIYGGLKEFMTNDNSYAIDFTEVKVGKYYNGGGKWCQPKMDSMVDLMRYVHQSRDEAMRRGLAAKQSVRELTWDNSCGRLFQTLTEFGLL